MLKLLTLAIGGFISLSSYGSDYYDALYQECRDSDFTSQIIEITKYQTEYYS